MASILASVPIREPSTGTTSTSSVESRGDRFLRHRHRARLYSWAIIIIALLAVLVVLISRNSRVVKLDWAFGSTHASLVWIILAAAVLGWLVGIATGAVFHHRTRSPR